MPTTQIESEEFEKLLVQIGKTKKLVIWVIDIFDFDGSYIRNIEDYLKNNNVIIVGNKKDLLPKNINNQKIKNWFIDMIDDDINVVDVLIASAIKKFNVDRLLELIDEFSTGDVYLIGATNTGKSTLVNSIINSVYPNKKQNITTSYFAGTTLSTIEIMLDDRTTLIDTPGIVNNYQVTNYLETSSLKKVFPKGEVRQRMYQLNDQQTLYISGLFRIDFVEGDKSCFAVFVSSNIDVHRTKLENADKFYEKHISTGPLLPPSEADLEKLPELKKCELLLKEGRHSLGLAGLGYINIVAKSDLVIHAYSPNGESVVHRKGVL